MPIEREDLEAIFADLEARMKVAQEESIQKAVEEARPTSIPTTATIPPTNRKRRIVMVVIVVGSLIMVDHVFAIAAIMRGSEMFIGAFFSWWFDEAKAGMITFHLKKIQISKLKDIDLQKIRPVLRRKAPAPTVAPKQEEKEAVTEEE